MRATRTDASPPYIEVAIGEDWGTVKNLNQLHDLDAGIVVCHVHPAPADLSQDLLRALGMRSNEPGWPDNDVDSRRLTETWLRALSVRKIVFYPAEHLCEGWLTEFSTIAFEGEIIAAARDSNRETIEDLRNALDDESAIVDRWELIGDIPELPKFKWPEQPLMARAEALRSYTVNRFVGFDDAWTHAYNMTHESPLGSGHGDVARWLRTIATKSDGQICPALLIGAVCALIQMNRSAARLLPTQTTIDRPMAKRPHASASPELQTVVVLRANGFSSSEISAMCIGQVGRRDRTLQIMGIPLSEDHSIALRAQLVNRIWTGAKATDPLIADKKARGNRLAIRQALEWRPRPETETQQEAEAWPDFSVDRVIDPQTFSATREIEGTDRRRGIPLNQFDASEATVNQLLAGGFIETNGDNIRKTDALRFCLGENEHHCRWSVRARRTRNFARLAEQDPRISTGFSEEPTAWEVSSDA